MLWDNRETPHDILYHVTLSSCSEYKTALRLAYLALRLAYYTLRLAYYALRLAY